MNVSEYMTDAERAEYDRLQELFAFEPGKAEKPPELLQAMQQGISADEYTAKINEYSKRKALLEEMARAKICEAFRGCASELLERFKQELQQISPQEYEEKHSEYIKRLETLQESHPELDLPKEALVPDALGFYFYITDASNVSEYFTAFEMLGAEAAKESAEATTLAEKLARDKYPEGLLPETLPEMAAAPKAVKDIPFPLDKINAHIWNLYANTRGNGQIAFDTAKRGEETALVYYSIDFSELEEIGQVKITKLLTPFDKRVQECIAALWNAGNEIVSPTQIYSVMTGKKKPDKGSIKKVNDSITKMQCARIYLSNIKDTEGNSENAEATRMNYPEWSYNANLLPCERLTLRRKGQTFEAIHLFREPPLITFAKDRKQITAISPQLLASPINKNEETIRIEDYLLERIAHMKRGSKLSEKILYKTFFEKCEIKGKQQQRAPEKIRKFLDYWADTDGRGCKPKWIESFTEMADGVTIHARKEAEKQALLLTGGTEADESAEDLKRSKQSTKSKRN